ncbi:MAG: tRNA-dihydrouridine synthase [Patescibacteria group bacterium]|nr:tRNA-dihydrouridine synthase [Patescibacteria group bacterium]
MDFWHRLKKPILALAPMADVTDAAFRRMFAKYGKPDVMFTEFVSTDGLCSAGRKNLLRELKFHPSERPIVAQLWGRNPEHFFESAKLIAGLGFDGIDINFGCPQRKEIGQGTCGALIAEPKLARKIIAATKRGAGDLPVSVKTRVGFKKIETEKWVRALLGEKPAAITLHARTVKEMSKVPAHWEEIRKAVELRDKLKSRTRILGNGDVRSLEEANQRIAETGCDGVMVGRGAFGNPWFFNPNVRFSPLSTPPHRGEWGFIFLNERLAVMVEHARLFEKLFGRTKNFAVMRKHFKAYASGFDGAAALRAALMQAKNSNEVSKAAKAYRPSFLVP